jgi:hypothetical protein
MFFRITSKTHRGLPNTINFNGARVYKMWVVMLNFLLYLPEFIGASFAVVTVSTA